MSAKTQHHTERGFDRLVNFSDAVVAIAITLLVLPLADLTDEAPGTDAITLIADNGDTFLAFVMSFLVTGMYWLIHHRVFESIVDYDSALAWLNMFWLMGIVLIPFTSSLVADDGWGGGSGTFYCLSLGLVSALLGLISVHVRRTPALQAPGAAPDPAGWIRAWVFTGFFVALAVVAWYFPDQASWAMFLLFPLGRAVRRPGI